MRANEFINEAFFGINPWQAMGKYAVKKLGQYTNPSGDEDPGQKKRFINSFVQQFNREHQTHPDITANDFMQMYWRKNNWNASGMPPAYQKSLDTAINNVNMDPSIANVQQLGNIVYSLALMMPTAQSNRPSYQDVEV